MNATLYAIYICTTLAGAPQHCMPPDGTVFDSLEACQAVLPAALSHEPNDRVIDQNGTKLHMGCAKISVPTWTPAD